MLLLIGYARFLRRPPLWWPTIAVLSIYIVALVWFTLAAPQPSLRVGINSLAVALFTGATCYILLHDMRDALFRSEEHTSELQSLMRISYAVFCLKKKKHNTNIRHTKTY